MEHKDKTLEELEIKTFEEFTKDMDDMNGDSAILNGRLLSQMPHFPNPMLVSTLPRACKLLSVAEDSMNNEGKEEAEKLYKDLVQFILFEKDNEYRTIAGGMIYSITYYAAKSGAFVVTFLPSIPTNEQLKSVMRINQGLFTTDKFKGTFYSGLSAYISGKSELFEQNNPAQQIDLPDWEELEKEMYN